MAPKAPIAQGSHGGYIFSYDYGRMFCVLDAVFAKSVTGITGSG
jgi:hypothetical protein